ncbi:MAG: hypothetical protein ABI388_06770 [Bacteroidia bacterium]
MKRIKRLSIVAVFLGLVFLNTTCNKKPFTKISYNGFVYDSLGGRPVPNVSVNLSACKGNTASTDCDKFDYGTVYTNEKGYFTFGFFEKATSHRYFVLVNSHFAYNGTTPIIYDTWIDEISESQLTNGTRSKLYLK